MTEYPVRDDSLCWSHLLGSFRVDEDEHICVDESVPDDYLFRLDVFSQEFWVAASDMAQLNDFCVLCLEQTAVWSERLEMELSDLRCGKKQCTTALGDFTGEMIMQLEEQIPVWNDTREFMSRAMCLIMLSAFAEKSLKSLCIALGPRGEMPPRPLPHESKVACYLRFLNEKCHIDCAEPQESVDMRDECRRIRNSFAHGDWDAVREGIQRVNLRSAFRAVASLLYSIEAGACSSPQAKRRSAASAGGGGNP